MLPGTTLESHGITSGSTITTVRRELIPEGLQTDLIPYLLAIADMVGNGGFLLMEQLCIV